jgi:hypothetical protein
MAVLVAPVPVDVFALVGMAEVVDAVDLGAGAVEQEPEQASGTGGPQGGFRR